MNVVRNVKKNILKGVLIANKLNRRKNKMTRDELIKMYTDGKRDFSYANLSCANLSGADLSGADLSCADYKDVVIKHVRVFTSLYKYQVWAIIAEDDSEWIRLGCFFRKREEWNENFWNNDKEFKNDNSEASNMRLAAFNFACKWIDERKKAQTKEKKNEYI